jgi:hypothetical protein
VAAAQVGGRSVAAGSFERRDSIIPMTEFFRGREKKN